MAAEGTTPNTAQGLAQSAEQGKRSRWQGLDRYRGLFAFVFVFILGCIFTPHVRGSNTSIFLLPRTQLDILYEYCEYGLLATGMTLVILTGGIDLVGRLRAGLRGHPVRAADDRLRLEHRGGCCAWRFVRAGGGRGQRAADLPVPDAAVRRHACHDDRGARACETDFGRHQGAARGAALVQTQAGYAAVFPLDEPVAARHRHQACRAAVS